MPAPRVLFEGHLESTPPGLGGRFRVVDTGKDPKGSGPPRPRVKVEERKPDAMGVERWIPARSCDMGTVLAAALVHVEARSRGDHG